MSPAMTGVEMQGAFVGGAGGRIPTQLSQSVAQQVMGVGIIRIGLSVRLKNTNRRRPIRGCDGLSSFSQGAFFRGRVAVGHIDRQRRPYE